MCVPSGCSHTDVEILLRESLSNFTQGLQFSIQVRVEAEMCQVRQHPVDKVDRNTIYAAAFFAFFLVIALGMTLYDHYVPEGENKSGIYNYLFNLSPLLIISLLSRRMAHHVLLKEEHVLTSEPEKRRQ